MAEPIESAKELPGWQVFGPNGEAVAAHIERCKTITADEMARLYAAWRSARNAARSAAFNAAWNAARNALRNAAFNAAFNAAWDAARYPLGDAARNAAGNAAWNTAEDAAWYAGAALVVRDLISPEQFDLLYGPWASVFGVADERTEP